MFRNVCTFGHLTCQIFLISETIRYLNIIRASAASEEKYTLVIGRSDISSSIYTMGL